MFKHEQVKNSKFKLKKIKFDNFGKTVHNE
jgi:hypothetical protein